MARKVACVLDAYGIILSIDVDPLQKAAIRTQEYMKKLIKAIKAKWKHHWEMYHWEMKQQERKEQNVRKRKNLRDNS